MTSSSIDTSVQIKSNDVAFNEYSNQELHDLIEQNTGEFLTVDTENQVFLSFICNEDTNECSRIMNGLGKLPQDIDELGTLNGSFEIFSWIDGSSVVDSIYSRRSKRSLSIFGGSQKSLFTGTTDTSGVHSMHEQLSLMIKLEITEKEIKRKDERIKKIIRDHDQLQEQLSCKEKEVNQSTYEIKHRTNEFKKEVVTNGVDPITSRIPAETFLKFIRIKIKQDNTLTDKLRLRIASYNQTAKTIQKKLLLKKQLGGILRPIDFEQLEIDKNQLGHSLKDKDSQFYGLKQVNGQISLACAEQKKALDEKLNLMRDLKMKAEMIKQSIERMKQEKESVSEKLDKVRSDMEKLKYKMKHYLTPSVDDYCNKKEMLREIEARNKALRREYELVLSKYK